MHCLKLVSIPYICLVLIPTNCASQVQPLHQSAIYSFKARYQKWHLQWLRKTTQLNGSRNSSQTCRWQSSPSQAFGKTCGLMLSRVERFSLMEGRRDATGRRRQRRGWHSCSIVDASSTWCRIDTRAHQSSAWWRHDSHRALNHRHIQTWCCGHLTASNGLLGGPSNDNGYNPDAQTDASCSNPNSGNAVVIGERHRQQQLLHWHGRNFTCIASSWGHAEFMWTLELSKRFCEERGSKFEHHFIIQPNAKCSGDSAGWHKV